MNSVSKSLLPELKHSFLTSLENVRLFKSLFSRYLKSIALCGTVKVDIRGEEYRHKTIFQVSIPA